MNGRPPGALDADRFFGKYPGVVTNADDPLEIGRVRAKVPEVLGREIESGWALPCAPFGGGKDRGLLFLPEVGDTIWIEFAAGDIMRPIWSGAFWGAPESAGQQDDLAQETGSELPTSEGTKAGPAVSILRTAAGHRIVMDDDGEIVILAHGGDQAEIRLTRQGEVIVKAAKIKLGSDGATEPLVLGNTFLQYFNAHTHPTGVGPSGPPTPPMTPGQLSTKGFTE
jgi:uncharacterized protein involved in type VI secretion and phage assembly